MSKCDVEILVSGLCEKTINYVVTLVSLVSGFPYKLRLAFAPCRWIIVWQKQRANKVVMSTTPFIIIPIYLYCTHRRTTSDNRPPAQLLSRLSLYPNPAVWESPIEKLLHGI
jgi:hypothetical protein